MPVFHEIQQSTFSLPVLGESALSSVFLAVVVLQGVRSLCSFERKLDREFFIFSRLDQPKSP